MNRKKLDNLCNLKKNHLLYKIYKIYKYYINIIEIIISARSSKIKPKLNVHVLLPELNNFTNNLIFHYVDYNLLCASYGHMLKICLSMQMIMLKRIGTVFARTL